MEESPIGFEPTQRTTRNTESGRNGDWYTLSIENTHSIFIITAKQVEYTYICVYVRIKHIIKKRS